MSISTTLNFDNGTNWEYDSNKVEFVGSKAQLKLQNNPNQLFPIDFASDAGFTYDNTKAEFSGGKLQQKAVSIIENYSQPFTADTGFTYNSSYVEFASGLARQISQVPTNSTFGATYTSSINGSFGGGTLTGTAHTGATITGTRLDLSGSVPQRNVTYSATGNGNFTQTGCVRFKYTPNYSGAPATQQYILCIGTTGSKNSLLQIYHYTNGYIRYAIRDNAGTFLGESIYLWTTNVAGTTYEIEFNIDLTAGAGRLFLNGNQVGSTSTATGTRSAAQAQVIRIGGDVYSTTDGNRTPNFYLEDLIIFDTAQHISNYTPGYTLIEAMYVESTLTCPSVPYTYNIASFGVPTCTDTNSPKYIINGYAYFGGSWQASSTTYATAMTKADWIANIATFPSGQLGSAVVVKVVFQTSNTLGSIDSTSFNINETHYVETSAITPELEYTGLGTLVSFDDFVTVESGTPRYSIQIGRSGNYLYWNGASWVTSDGSYTQANSAATFDANVSSLSVSGQVCGQFKLHFNESNTQSYIDNLEADLTAQTYTSGDESIESKTGITSDDFTSFTSVNTIPANTDIGFVIKRSSSYYYYNGTSWVTSDLSIAQSNTAQEIEDNLDALIGSADYITVYPVAILNTDGSDTPDITSITQVYEYYDVEGPEIPECIINFYIEDLLGDNYSDVTFTVYSKKAFWHSDKQILPFRKSVVANEDGYIRISVIETETISQYLYFELSYTNPNTNSTQVIKYKKAIVPNQESIQGDNLLTI